MMVLFDKFSHFSRLDQNVPSHLRKLLSPVPLFCILLARTILPNVQWLSWVKYFNRNVLFHWAREISNRNFAEWKVPLNSALPRTNPASHQGKTRGVGYTDPIPKLNVVYSAGNGRHLLPSAKLTFSSQWISQDISLFLHEISLSLEISVHKSRSLFNF